MISIYISDKFITWDQRPSWTFSTWI